MLSSLIRLIKCEDDFKYGSHQYAANAQIEDRVSAVKMGKSLLVSVFDGHGGWQVAERLRSSLPANFVEASRTLDAAAALPVAFVAADEELKQVLGSAYSLGFSKLARVGACGLSLLIEDDKITVANAGDCKAVLSRRGKAIALNRQLNANDPFEQDKLRLAHPGEDDIVRCKREWTVKEPLGGWWGGTKEVVRFGGCYVKGVLQPTKSFGDFYLKDDRFKTDFDRNRSFIRSERLSFPYITAEPDTSEIARSRDDEFVILASDGLWDELTDEEACEVARQAKAANSSPEAVAVLLVKAALAKAADSASMRVEDLVRLPQGPQRRSLHDDISVIVVFL